jgi:hypothetical protein
MVNSTTGWVPVKPTLRRATAVLPVGQGGHHLAAGHGQPARAGPGHGYVHPEPRSLGWSVPEGVGGRGVPDAELVYHVVGAPEGVIGAPAAG